MPAGFQLSGLYFAASGNNQTTVPGSDVRLTGSAAYPGRLRRDGTLIDRNNFNGKALHRIDLRLQRRFKVARHITLDGLFEVFNLLNHDNFGSFNVNEASATFLTPTRDTNLAYAPRMLQLGFRLAF
jgi:hypothetical protein